MYAQCLLIVFNLMILGIMLLLRLLHFPLVPLVFPLVDLLLRVIEKLFSQALRVESLGKLS